MIVSSADDEIVVMENGDTVASGHVTITPADTLLGSHVLIYGGIDPAARQMIWHAIPYTTEATAQTAQEAAGVLQRIRGTDAIFRRIQDRLHPGAILITTDLPLTPETRSGKDFVVMSAADA
jgi:hypothetical protein